MHRIVIALALGVTVSLLGGHTVLAGTIPASKVSSKVATVPGSTVVLPVGSPGTPATLQDAANGKYTKYCPKDGGKDGRCPAAPTPPSTQIVVTIPVVPGILPPQQTCPPEGCNFTVVGFPPSTPIDISITGGDFPTPVTVASTTTDANGTAPIFLILDGMCGGPGSPVTFTVTVSTTSGTPTTTTSTVTC